MRAFKGRQLSIALMLAVFVPISVLGIQTLAFAARNPAIGSAKAHNPTCGSAFGERVCVTASPTGLTFKWSGYSYRAGTTETLGISGNLGRSWDYPARTMERLWHSHRICTAQNTGRLRRLGVIRITRGRCQQVHQL